MTENYEIRRLQPEQGLEWKPLRCLMLAESPEAFNTHLTEILYQPDEYWIERAKKVTTLVLSQDGKDLGTIGVTLEEPVESGGGVAAEKIIAVGENELVYRLISFWIHPKHRGQGFSKALMEAGEGIAREKGASRIRLEAMKENIRAIRLYEAQGYRLIKVTDKSVLYEKKL